MRQDLVHRAFCHDVAPLVARAGPQVDDMIGGADGVLVVLHDDDGVAEIAKLPERAEQPGVVALVQTDARLVQHVEHADQTGPDLRGQADPLRFATGQRAGAPPEREVFEPHIPQEYQTVADLLENRPRDFRIHASGQIATDRNSVEVRHCIVHRHVHHIADAATSQKHREALGLEPPPAAGPAGHFDEKLLELGTHGVAAGLVVAPLDVPEDAFPLGFVIGAAASPVAAELEQLPRGTVQQHVAGLGGQGAPGRI